VARVVALIPDLLFGSKVQGMLQQAGHEVELVTGALESWDGAGGADVLIVDLVGDPEAGIALPGRLGASGGPARPRTLAVYSHVDADTRRRAGEAGFDVVVPRSRMMREGAELVTGLAQA
jgi:hypothetical protein